MQSLLYVVLWYFWNTYQYIWCSDVFMYDSRLIQPLRLMEGITCYFHALNIVEGLVILIIRNTKLENHALGGINMHLSS